MDIPEKVKERLVVGLIQYLSAQAAGLSKFAIADAYLAIDNYFSALLIEHGIEPPRNHWKKFKKFHKIFGHILEKRELSKENIREFYEDWLAVRYSSKTLPPKKVINYLRMTYQILTLILSAIAEKYCRTKDELENELYAEVAGDYWSKFEEEVAIVHETWQMHLEMLGERGHSSKLLNKMLFNPSNFCGICLLTDDESIKRIITEDDEIIRMIGEIYNMFLKLIMRIWDIRAQRGIELTRVLDFMISLRIGYHGRPTMDIIKELREAISRVLKEQSTLHGNDDHV